MLEIRRLRLLRELQLRGTLGAVAEALGYTTSFISQQLALLERETGHALLERRGRRVALTARAEILCDYTTRLLDLVEEAEGALQSSESELAGTVRVATLQSSAHALVPAMLTLLAERHPGLRVEVEQREPEEALFETAARSFDLVIAEEYPEQTRPLRGDLDRVELASDSISLALPDSLVGRVHALADTSGLPWVMEPRGTLSRAWATQLCRTAGVEPDVRYETADLMAHIRLVRSGNAVALLPEFIWAGEPAAVRLLPLPGTPRRTLITSTRLAARTSPAVRAVREALAAATP